ncbi:helix-turn-helix domain-containing protein [Rhodobacter sp. NSM]|uniref:helix-turn-helix domain-containing protein n=1 Tax=Rhodobacter sp. NSM TaxID=3457501 RepID=UPI003FD586C7
MGELSMREAARLFDVSRPTLAKRIKEGKISARPAEGGGWLIDPSELLRAGIQARQPRRPSVVNPVVNVGQGLTGQLTTPAGSAPVNGDPHTSLLAQEVEALKTKLTEAERRAAVAEALAQERAERIEDLRRMLPPPDRAEQASGVGQRRWWFWLARNTHNER